jgi:hypothetical protein
MSCLYLKNKFPEIDLTDAMWPLSAFILDGSSNTWRRAGLAEQLGVDEAIRRAEAWFKSFREGC